MKEQNGVSASKQKRIEREKKASGKKRNDVILNIVVIVLAVAIVGGIIAAIAVKAVNSSNQVVASSNYSEELNDNGFIKGVKATDYINLVDYKNIVVPESEVAYTDEEIDADIQSARENHKVLNTEEGTISDGDTVNIDYVGTIDGVEFDGGNSNGQGSDLTIGSGTFIDDFEQQLIGYKVGDITNVEVTFPDDYATAELAGKDAVFEVTVNGIYELPEFTDEFVAENLSAYATTVDGYFQYLKNTNYETKLDNYVRNYLSENTTVIKYPKKYLKTLKAANRYADEESYEYMNQIYMQYYGGGYNSFEEYTGLSEEDYLAELTTRSEEDCKNDLIYQAIFENEGMSVTVDDVKELITKNYGSSDQYDELAEQFGAGYLANERMGEMALEYVKSCVTVQ